MKMKLIGLTAAMLACLSVPAAAQEHWTEGPVWECSAYRTNPGQFDAYLEWIRTHVEPVDAEAKKQGLILDYKTFVQAPRDEDDYDVMFCTLHANYGRALDFNQGNYDKSEAISAAHWGTPDNKQQLAKTAPRLEMRRFMGTSYSREVNLRPAN